MKAERWICGLWAFLLAFGAAFGSVGGLISGFSLEEDLLLLALVLAVAALLCVLAGVFRLYLLPLGGLLAACALFWKDLLASARYLVSLVCEYYDRAYHCGVPQWSEEVPVGDSAMWILAVLGCCVLCMVVTAVLSGRGMAISGLASLIPLIPCIVITDTVPEAGYLFPVMVSMVLLLLAARVRAGSLRKGNTLLLYLLLPVLAGVGLLFALMPRESYTGQEGAAKLEAYAVKLWEELDRTLPGSTAPLTEKTSPTVDLSHVGPNPELGMRVMNVKADTTGTLYLRGSSYDTYTGTGWTASGKESGNNADYSGQGDYRYAVIQTLRVHDVLYCTYMPRTLAGVLKDGRLPNEYSRKEYTVSYQEPLSYDPAWDVLYFDPYGEFGEVYLQLPLETRLWASQWLGQEILELQRSGQVHAAALTIGQLVRGIADYDRMTEAMPAGKTDFAQWFMEESSTGYCTHFATAAAVLLRAAGIPARYVTGYLAHTEAGLYSKVTTDEAHAWVEYYLEGVGWLVLEATPSAEASPVLPENTQPIPTVPPTEETEPSQPQPTVPQPTETQPGESTAPSQSTEPSRETEAAQPESTRPVPGTEPAASADPATGPGEPGDASLPDWAKTVLQVLGWTACVLVGIVVQWQLRLRLRHMRRHRGRANRQLLTLWREAALVCRLLKCQSPERLHQLALRAKFSQYMITREELLEMSAGLEGLIARLRQRPFWQRWIYRLVFAIY